MLVNLLNNLIEKKFYKNKEEIQNKLDVFYAMNKINDEEYTSLTLKVEEKYKVEEIVEETETEEKTTDTVESEG
mgnify:CR=1 FL=1